MSKMDKRKRGKYIDVEECEKNENWIIVLSKIINLDGKEIKKK